MVFKTVPEQPSTHLTHPIQLASSLEETEMGQKSYSWEKIRCMSDPRHVQRRLLNKQQPKQPNNQLL